MTTIADLIAGAGTLGIFQFGLPFILSFAIAYGILAKAKIFGEEKTGKRINIVVAGVLSLLLMYSPFGIILIEYFGKLFSGTILVIVTILGAMMILYVLASIVGIKIPADKLAKRWTIILLLIIVLLAAGVFISSGGKAFFPGLELPGVTIPTVPIPAIPALGISMGDLAIIAVFLGLIGIMWWIQKG